LRTRLARTQTGAIASLLAVATHPRRPQGPERLAPTWMVGRMLMATLAAAMSRVGGATALAATAWAGTKNGARSRSSLAAGTRPPRLAAVAEVATCPVLPRQRPTSLLRATHPRVTRRAPHGTYALARRSGASLGAHVTRIAATSTTMNMGSGARSRTSCARNRLGAIAAHSKRLAELPPQLARSAATPLTGTTLMAIRAPATRNTAGAAAPAATAWVGVRSGAPSRTSKARRAQL